MQLLPKWVLPPTMPSVYDSESFTALEMVAKVYGAMNELIAEYNTFADSVNKKIDTFTAETEEQYNLFAMDLRQEFQDFIDVVDIKIKAQDKDLETVIKNIESLVKTEVNTAIANGGIFVGERYDPVTESLYITTGGEV